MADDSEDCPSLLSLPPHLLHVVLSHLDGPDLCAASNTCTALLSACSDSRLWQVCPKPSGCAVTVGSRLARALRVPSHALAPRVIFRPMSNFKVELSMVGVRALLARTEIGVAADAASSEAAKNARSQNETERQWNSTATWLMHLTASPTECLAREASAASRADACGNDSLLALLAEKCSTVNGVLCVRPERGVLRLQMRPSLFVGSALREFDAWVATAVENGECLSTPRPGWLPVQSWRNGRKISHPVSVSLNAVIYLGRIVAADEKCHSVEVGRCTVRNWPAIAASATDTDAKIAICLHRVCTSPPAWGTAMDLASAAEQAKPRCFASITHSPPLSREDHVATAALLIASGEALQRVCMAMKMYDE